MLHDSLFSPLFRFGCGLRDSCVTDILFELKEIKEWANAPLTFPLDIARPLTFHSHTQIRLLPTYDTLFPLPVFSGCRIPQDSIVHARAPLSEQMYPGQQPHPTLLSLTQPE